MTDRVEERGAGGWTMRGRGVSDWGSVLRCGGAKNERAGDWREVRQRPSATRRRCHERYECRQLVLTVSSEEQILKYGSRV
jgi:hypothetical protein